MNNDFEMGAAMVDASSDEELQQIVAKAYGAIAKPEGMVELIEELAEAEGQIAGFSDKADVHLTNAADILDTIYPIQGSDYSKITAQRITEMQGDLALDCHLNVISSNPEIFELERLQPDDNLKAMLFGPANEKRIEARLRGLLINSETEFFQLFVSPIDEVGRWFSAIKSPSEHGDVFVFQAVRLRWSDAAGRNFQAALKLTDVEIALTKHLVTGGQLRSFAEKRNRSIGTVRNQLKALQRKLAIRSKEALLLLYAGFVHATEMPNESADPVQHICNNIFPDNNSGPIAWEEYGDPNGNPVVFFHPLEGALLAETVRNSARDCGLRLIAPWRPYYGETSGQGWSVESARNFAPRVGRLLDHLEVDSTIGLTTQAGSPYMMAMVQQDPARFSKGVMAAGYMPFVDRIDFESIPKSHQLQMRLARMVPAFARIYQKSMLASIRDGEFYRFVENFYRDCPRDLAALRSPDMLATLRRTALYLSNTGFDGNIDTMLSWAADWSELCHNIETPIQMLVGEDDRAMPLDFAYRSAAKYGFKKPEIIPGTGGFMLFERPDIVMQYLRKSFDLSK